MRLDWSTLALQAINVLVLVWLLSRFLYRPVLAAIAARQAEAARLLDGAAAARAQAETDAAALKAARDGLAAKREAAVAQARVAAEAERAAILKRTAEDAAATQARAGAALAAERTATRRSLEAEICGLGVSIAEKLLRQTPPQAVADSLFQALADRIAALPEAERRRLAAENPALEVVGAAPAAEAEQARRRAALAQALGAAPISVSFRTDPALIAGFELRGPHIVISNSWRAGLDRIAAELAHLPEAADAA